MKTIRLKVKREAYGWLNSAATEVNQIWNWANEHACSVYRNTGRRLSGYDLCNATAGSTNYFDKIGADIINKVCTEYANKRRASNLPRLKWRVSAGPRRSLGWVPFKGKPIRQQGNAVRMLGKTLRVFDAGRLPEKFRDGCFAQDSCGDWWFCVPVSVETTDIPAPMDAVGVDLGLKTAAVTSGGETLESRHYRALEPKIAQAQRRGHKRQAKRIHRKAARCRSDALHKFSTALVAKYQRIYVGDVSSTKLVKTRMAKSVLDAGWGMLRNQLEYKSQQASRQFLIVNESYTSVTCSACGSLSGPRGVNGLAVRTWMCGDCGESHDRDRNAAQNILIRGEASPSVRERAASMNADCPVWLEDARRTA